MQQFEATIQRRHCRRTPICLTVMQGSCQFRCIGMGRRESSLFRATQTQRRRVGDFAARLFPFLGRERFHGQRVYAGFKLGA